MESPPVNWGTSEFSFASERFQVAAVRTQVSLSTAGAANQSALCRQFVRRMWADLVAEIILQRHTHKN
jgi:hypothetical protein